MKARTKLDETWELPGNATLALSGGVGVVVRVERGTVLVTQEGDFDDHVLERGEEFVLSRPGLAVAWALTDAAVRLGVAVHRKAA